MAASSLETHIQSQREANQPDSTPGGARQIEVRAFEKVRNAVRHRVAAMEQPEALAEH